MEVLGSGAKDKISDLGVDCTSPRFQQFDLFESGAHKIKTPKAECRMERGDGLGLGKVLSPKRVQRRTPGDSHEAYKRSDIGSGKERGPWEV